MTDPNPNPDHGNGNGDQQPPPRDHALAGNLYVYTDTDLQDIAAEVYATAREYPAVDDATADHLANLVYDLHTGDWLQR